MEVTSASSLNVTGSTEDATPILRTFGVTVGIIDILIGSVGNLLTFFAIWSNKKLHKPFYILIANLCVIDFLTAAVMMPFNVTSYATRTWPFGEDALSCSFMAYSYYCCGYSSIVCLLTITVNRFVGIVYPEMYNVLFTKRRLVIIIVISWLFTPTFLAPFFFFKPRGFAWNENVTLCVFNIGEEGATYEYMQFVRVLFQLLPLVVMITLYGKIFLTSKHIGQAVTKMSMKSNTEPSMRERARTYSGTTTRPYNFTSSLLSRNAGSTKNNSTSFNLLFTQDINSNCSSSFKICNEASDNRSDHQNSHGQIPVIDLTAAEETKPVVGYQAKSLQGVSSSLNSSDSLLHITKQTRESEYSYSSRSPPYSMKKKLNLNLHCSEDAKCTSAPNSPLFGARRIISSRSLRPVDSIRSTTSSQPFASYSPGRRGSPSSQRSSPSMQRSNKLGGAHCRYSSAIRKEAKRRKSVDRRLLQISVTICSVFTILFLPSVILNLIPGKHPSGAHMMASVVTWLNSCANPIIYCFMNAKMRDQYRLLLQKATAALCRCLNIPQNRFKVGQQSFQSSTRFRQSFKSTSSTR